MSRRSTRVRKTRQPVAPELSDDNEDEEQVEPEEAAAAEASTEDGSDGEEARRRRTTSAPGRSGRHREDAPAEGPSAKRRASESSLPPILEASEPPAKRPTPETSPPPTRPRYFHLDVVQQPSKALAAGLGMNTLGRLPVVPVPVLQLVEVDDQGNWLDDPPSPSTCKHFFCSCSLIAAQEDDDEMDVDQEPEVVDWVDPIAGEGRLQALIGQLHCDLKHVLSLEGRPAAYFIFGDVTVRKTGRYRLRFSAFDALPGSTCFATSMSAPFLVFDRQHYPGDVGVSDLTRHLYECGMRIYMPALEDPDLLVG